MATCSDETPKAPPHISLEDDPRQDAFGRIIVQSFAQLIADERGEVAADRISRAAARGVLAVFNSILGNHALAEYQALCRDVLVRVSKGRRMPRWDSFYDDDIAKEVRESALIRLAFHLEGSGPTAPAFARLINATVSREGTNDNEP